MKRRRTILNNMIPELTFEEKVSYIQNHFDEIFKDNAFFCSSRRNVEMFISRFSNKISLAELARKYTLSNERVRQILSTTERKIRNSGVFSFSINISIPKLKKLGDTPIDDLGLSPRSYNGLRSNNIHTLGALLRNSESDLLKTKNLGKKSIREIKIALNAHGLLLRFCNSFH
mgnify:CR=1 FL=1